MRLLRLAAIGIIALFLADLGFALATSQGLGVTVTPVSTEPSEPELPTMPSDPDTGQPEPEAPVVPSVDNGELDDFNQLVSSASGSFSEGAFVTKRAYGSGWVSVEMRSKPQALEYMVATSYGCSLLAGGSTHGYGAMKVCTINDVLPVAPSGYSRERWWYLIELDAFGEGVFARYAAAQGTISQSGGPISAWGKNFMLRVFSRDDYLAWVRQMYSEHFSSDYRGVAYTEQSVASSCGGVWLAWAAPWGCVNVQVYFQSRLLSAGYSRKDDSNRHIYDLLYHTRTDPIGVEGDKWPSQGGAPPMDGDSLYRMGVNVFRPTDRKPLMGRSFRLTVTESFTNVFPTSDQDLLTADVKVEMSDGVGWKDVTAKTPCVVVSGADLAHCSDEETFGIGAVAGWSPLRTQVGGLTWSEKMWRYVLNSKGEAVQMADGDWSKITNYLESRPLIDRLIFAAWYEVNKPTGGGTAIDHAISVFNEKLTTGNWWGLDDLSLLMIGYSGRAETAPICDLLLLREAADHIKRGEVARYNLQQQCTARLRTAYPSGGGILLPESLVFMLTSLYMFPVAGLVIVDISNYLLLAPLAAGVLLVLDWRWRRKKTRRI